MVDKVAPRRGSGVTPLSPLYPAPPRRKPPRRSPRRNSPPQPLKQPMWQRKTRIKRRPQCWKRRPRSNYFSSNESSNLRRTSARRSSDSPLHRPSIDNALSGASVPLPADRRRSNRAARRRTFDSSNWIVDRNPWIPPPSSTRPSSKIGSSSYRDDRKDSDATERLFLVTPTTTALRMAMMMAMTMTPFPSLPLMPLLTWSKRAWRRGKRRRRKTVRKTDHTNRRKRWRE